MRQLRRHSHGPAIVAKEPGRCKLCPHPIRPKIDFISEVDGGVGWMHAHCAQNYCRVLDENLEDEDRIGGEG